MMIVPPNQAKRELVIERLFDAPRDVVWKAWTDPAIAVRWWGPKEYPAVQLEMDVRPGGTWFGRLHGVEDGRVLTHRGVFREVKAPERMVFSFAWDEEGERGLETEVTIVFTEENGRTRMNFRQIPFMSDGERDGHTYGWNSTFDRLVQAIL